MEGKTALGASSPAKPSLAHIRANVNDQSADDCWFHLVRASLSLERYRNNVHCYKARPGASKRQEDSLPVLVTFTTRYTAREYMYTCTTCTCTGVCAFVNNRRNVHF